MLFRILTEISKQYIQLRYNTLTRDHPNFTDTLSFNILSQTDLDIYNHRGYNNI